MRHPTRTSPRGRRRPSARRSLSPPVSPRCSRRRRWRWARAPRRASRPAWRSPSATPWPGTSIAGATEVTTGTYVVPVPEPGQDHFFEIRRTQPGQVLWYGITADLEEPIFYGTLAATGIADGDETRTATRGRSATSTGCRT